MRNALQSYDRHRTANQQRLPVAFLLLAAALLAAGCASAPTAVGTKHGSTAPDFQWGETPKRLRQRVALMIERVERESHCRYLIQAVATQDRQVAASAPFVLLALAYRGPEVECRVGLERLNQRGAAEGVSFVAERVMLAADG